MSGAGLTTHYCSTGQYIFPNCVECQKKVHGYVPERFGRAPDDPVNHPKHYTTHPSGVECIDIVEYMSFNLGNAIKYLWRVGLKSENVDEDLAKAIWYIERERKRLRTPSPQKAPGAPLASGRKS